jgi:hypothetical protein
LDHIDIYIDALVYAIFGRPLRSGQREGSSCRHTHHMAREQGTYAHWDIIAVTTMSVKLF